MHTPPLIGVIGGSGLYELEHLTDLEEIEVKTPYGAPSDTLMKGSLNGRAVVFLPRHGRGHRLLPTEINHRANIWALRSLNVRFVICVTAVGSLREDYAPGHVVIPDQYADRTCQRPQSTFFGHGIVAHVSPADPYSPHLRTLLEKHSKEAGLVTHSQGTYVNMDGPAFSSRAESQINRQLGLDIVGMTNVPEVKLALEAEMALATLAMVTDYDCWKAEEDAVTTKSVLQHLLDNAENAKKILTQVIPNIPLTADWPEHSTLAKSLATPREFWPEETIEKLRPILNELI